MAAQWLRPVLPTQGPEFDPRVTSRLAELISPLSAHRTITPHHKEKSPLHIFFQPTLFKLLALQVSKSTFLARTPVLRNPSLGGEERRKGSGAAGGSRACRPPALRAEASGTPRPPLTKCGVLTSVSSILHDVKSQAESGVDVKCLCYCAI